MNQTDIFNKVKNIIVRELNKDKQLINLGASLKNDLGLDSIDQPLLAVALEEKFKIKISDEESVGLSTVTEVVELVEKKLGDEK
jgi:acyl carrier protein